MLLEIKNLTKFYKGADSAALNQVSLSVEKGCIHGLLGPNGAGKSTLINIIAGLLLFDSGTILWEGQEVSNINTIKKHLGLIPQDIALYPKLTVFENLDFIATQYNISKKVRTNRINNYLEALGLFERKNQKLIQLSGGMKRRVNLIAGLLHKPTLLIMDEPTVGIDVQSKQAIHNFLNQLNADGMSILYTSHMMEEAEKLCHRISIIDKAKILVSDSPNNLIEKFDNTNKLEDVFIHLTGRGLGDI